MGENCKNGWRCWKMDGLRFSQQRCVLMDNYSIPMWEGHIISNDLMKILEVMKEQSLFSLDSESRLHILRWPKTTTQRLKLPTEYDRMGSQLKFASGKPMNFIHAVDGTEARGTPETLRRTATHYINLPGAKYSTRTAEKRPEIHRFYWAGSEEVASAFQGLHGITLETRRLPKKGVSDSPRKWCKLGLICSEILYKSSRFAHPLNLQDSSSLSSSTPELPASVVLLKV